MLVDVVDAETAEDVYSENQALLLPSPSMAKRQEPPPHAAKWRPLKTEDVWGTLSPQSESGAIPEPPNSYYETIFHARMH